MKKYALPALLCGMLLLMLFLASAEALYLPEDEAALLDRRQLPTIPVYISVFCDGDETLEATIKVVAENRLQSLSGVRLAESLDDASIILSFMGRRQTLSGDVPQEIVAYSFAYGTAELEFVGDELVSLPRYIYHECTLSEKQHLAANIGTSIQYADSQFIEILKRYHNDPPAPEALSPDLLIGSDDHPPSSAQDTAKFPLTF